MDYILKSRARGKTYTLIQRSARTGETIICANRNMARYVNEKAKDLGMSIPEARPVEYLSDNNYDHSGEKILIDELEQVLKQVLKVDVSAITDTPDDIVIDTKDLSDSTDCYRSYFRK